MSSSLLARPDSNLTQKTTKYYSSLVITEHHGALQGADSDAGSSQRLSRALFSFAHSSEKIQALT